MSFLYLLDCHIPVCDIVYSAYGQRLSDCVGFQKPCNHSLVPKVRTQHTTKEKIAWPHGTALPQTQDTPILSAPRKTRELLFLNLSPLPSMSALSPPNLLERQNPPNKHLIILVVLRGWMPVQRSLALTTRKQNKIWGTFT